MTSTGRALAQVLAGSWRSEVPPLEMGEAQLEALSPLLADSGAGALAWRRLRHSALREHPSAALLHQAHIRQALDAQVQEQEIERLLELLDSHGVEPLLVKGWACARLYPEPGLRPFGDLDLFVRPEQAEVAERVLGVPVDVHRLEYLDVKMELPALYGWSLGEALACSQRVQLGRQWARVPSAEDQLRHLCLHFLKHGAWRPLWLCDIAVALESRPADFRWDKCLGRSRRRADAIACALGLAHQLLGADVQGTPVAERAASLPRWLAPEVLRQWASPRASQHRVPAAMIGTPLRPRPLLQALALRWPNPIEASTVLLAPLNIHPLPSQAVFYAVSCLRFLRRSVRTRS